MLLLLVFRYNTERINSAYAAYHGRFGKTIGGLPSINCYFYDWTAWKEEYILCFARTFRYFSLFRKKATGSYVKLLQHYNLGVHIGDYKPRFLVLFNITW